MKYSVIGPLVLLSATVALAAPANQYDWPHYAQSAGSTKYADLDQINRKTVAELQLAWNWDSVDDAHLAANPGLVPLAFKSTPIKIDNTLYISTSMGFVAALDAKTGKQKWSFDTQTYADGRPANLGFNHRGVAYWQSGTQQRIFMGTNNGYLWSLDANTGKPDTSFGTGGKIDLTQGLGRAVNRSYYSSVAAPLVVGDTIVLGSVVMDVPLAIFTPPKISDMPPGHVRGFDVKTGQQKWIFHTIPQAGEPGNETWEDDSWKITGGANVWSLMSADPELGYIYLPVGAGNNDWYGGQRLGDNLFGTSLVCLKAETGELVWHFQTTHHDLWDYDLPAAPNLVDITVEGKSIKAVAQITKQGFVFVLDRVSGKPVWPIEERPVPQSSVPGERAAATQPVPSRPAPFELQGVSEDNLIDYTPELRAQALKIISKYDYGELFTPPSLKGAIQLPGDGGGGNWPGGAFDPATGILYIPSFTHPIVVQIIEPPGGPTEFKYVRGGATGVRGPKRLPLFKPPYTRISALNLNTGDYEWVVPNGDGIRQKLIDMGIPDPGPVGAFAFSHVMVTRSLLWVTVTDGKPLLRALDKQTGEILHSFELPAAAGGAPMTYMVDGKQYISVAVGGAKKAGLVTLSLP